jgi:hypothetical protein
VVLLDGGQQTGSNVTGRAPVSHHEPTVLRCCNILRREASWWALCRGFLDGMQEVSREAWASGAQSGERDRRACGLLPPRQRAVQQPALAAPVAHCLPAGSFAVAARLLPDDLAPGD